jgi:membrane fusion protein (multidrug efflux system)
MFTPHEASAPDGAGALSLALPEPAAPAPAQWTWQRLGALLLLGGALILALAKLGALYLDSLAYESTDDAFIEGPITLLVPKVSGHVLRLHVQDNQAVEQGQLLAEIDPRDYEAAVARAKATLAAATARQQQAALALDSIKVTSGSEQDQAQEGVRVLRENRSEQVALLAAAKAEQQRSAALLQRRRNMESAQAASQEEVDAADTAARVAAANVTATERRLLALDAQIVLAQAKVRSADTAPLQVKTQAARVAQAQAEAELAQAELAQAELNLSYTKLYAPEAGRVAKKSIEPGSYVQPGSALLALVSNELWVEANFKETQLTHMRPGQPVTLRIDAFPDEHYQGRVESIRPGTGAQFSLLPAENATGNFVKTVQRVPVKIVFDPPPQDPRRLLPGLSVTPEVKVR